MKNSDIDWKVGKRVRDNEKNAHETWRERIPNCFQLECSEDGTKILFLGVEGEEVILNLQWLGHNKEMA